MVAVLIDVSAMLTRFGFECLPTSVVAFAPKPTTSQPHSTFSCRPSEEESNAKLYCANKPINTQHMYTEYAHITIEQTNQLSIISVAVAK